MPIFEISGDDVAFLDDEQLRQLVGRLCEAELQRSGYSSVHVTYGGDQNAADGGIDVSVVLPLGSVTDAFVPNNVSGFQVKRQKMPHNAIIAEMRPNGCLRPAIQTLADKEGAYIIVSSQESLTKLRLDDRRAAMLEAISVEPNADALKLDFYDRDRIAMWTRRHEGIALWLRETIGKPITGWRPYGAWAALTTGEYLADDEIRIFPGTITSGSGFSASKGIEAIRHSLSTPREVVRLVGLSGVGKTRFAQALFDNRVGEASLDPLLAIYTNVEHGPQPQPVVMASQLITAGTRAILVVDNCTRETHGHLAKICGEKPSNLSLLTIEHDVQEDKPEDTRIFKLEPSSPELIHRLVRREFPYMSDIDARSLVNLTGGNARVAIALAKTIDSQESFAGLTDVRIFKRLFEQGRGPNDSLYFSAQACSLVYSFDGEDCRDGGELACLAKIVGQTAQEIYRNVAELHRRDLVQKRGRWRAVLPHAIANHLAGVALKNTPYSVIESIVILGASERLLQSFSRRLWYLHGSREAVAVVKRWVEPGGLLSNIAELDELRRTILTNVAPTAPESVLAAIELAFAEDNLTVRRKGEPYLNLLRSLAYDSHLFERSATLMADILIGIGENSHWKQSFVSLFHMHLSGTLATVQQRLSLVNRLLTARHDDERSLGVFALMAILKTTHFLSTENFEFGARSRGYGLMPQTWNEQHEWFSLALESVEASACTNTPVSSQVRQAFAQEFRELWDLGCVADELEQVCRSIANEQFWPEGWRAVRRTLNFDGKCMFSDLRTRLEALERALRPVDLEQKVRSLVFLTRVEISPEDDDLSESNYYERRAQTASVARDLGRCVAIEEPILTMLLPEIMSCGSERIEHFGAGLLEGAADSRRMWQFLTDAMTATEVQRRNPLVLVGFLSALQNQDPALKAELLDKALGHEAHSTYFPYLQTATCIDEKDVSRLKRSLTTKKTPARSYQALAYGRATDPIPPADFRDLLMKIAKLPDGFDVAVDLLYMRLPADEEKEHDPALTTIGQQLLEELPLKDSDREDNQVGRLAGVCLRDPRGSVVAAKLCAKLKNAVATHMTNAFYHSELLRGLFSAQPLASLVALCGGDEDNLAQGVQILRDANHRHNLIRLVPENVLLGWCDEQPHTRYTAIARALPLLGRATDSEPLQWTALAKRFLEKAPNPSSALTEYVDEFLYPASWSGSFASLLAAKWLLLDELDESPELKEAVTHEKKRLHDRIEIERGRDFASHHANDERFE